MAAAVQRAAEAPSLLPPGSVPDGTRGRILEASVELFAASGFYGTSIRAIGARVGINSATLYAHYTSKEEILRDLVMIGVVELRRRMMDAAAGAASPAEKLSALVAAHVTAHASFPLLGIVTNDELHALSPEAAAPAIEMRRELADLVEDVLAEGVADGVFHLGDTRAAIQAIAGMGIHVATWFTADSLDSAEELGAKFAEFALRIAGAA